MAPNPWPKAHFPVRLVAFACVPMLLVTSGTVGYHLIQGWSWFHALYVTVLTLTSIGHPDEYSLSAAGRVFTMALALGGIFTIAVAATEVLGAVIAGELSGLWADRRMRKRIEAIEQHVIVCGYGRVGRQVCADLLSNGVPLVVIERREAALAAARDIGARALLGDATEDATLLRAGIARARALIAIAGSDPDNVLITITARQLCPALPIVARAEDDGTAGKLLAAGATRTVCPHAIVAGRMANAVLHPAVLDFIEVATRREYPDLHMEQESVCPGSPLDGKTVGASGLRARPGFVLVAIKRPNGEFAVNPGNDAAVEAGDILITLTAMSRSSIAPGARARGGPLARLRLLRRGLAFAVPRD